MDDNSDVQEYECNNEKSCYNISKWKYMKQSKIKEFYYLRKIDLPNSLRNLLLKANVWRIS